MISKCPEGKEPKKFNVVLYVDTSTSMNQPYNTTTRINAAKEAMVKFVESLPLGADKSNIAMYAPPTIKEIVSETNSAILSTKINALTLTGTEDISTQLKTIDTYLSAQDSLTKAPLILFLTDGFISKENPIDVAEELKAKGYRIVVVSFLTSAELNKKVSAFVNTTASYKDMLMSDFHKALATNNDYFKAYELDVVKLLGNLTNDLQECVNTEPSDPNTEVEQQPVEGIADVQKSKCGDPCSGWKILRNDGSIGNTDCGGINVKLPETVPQDQVKPEDMATLPPQEQKLVKGGKDCQDLIRNGNFERALDSWVVDQNDGSINVVADTTMRSMVFDYKYQGSKSDTNCIQIVNNPEFEDLSFWTQLKNDGYLGITKVTTCGSQLLMNRTINRSNWLKCEVPILPPVASPILVNLEYPCKDVSQNIKIIDVSQYIHDPNIDSVLTIRSITQPVKGKAVIDKLNIIYSPPPVRLSTDEEVMFQYTVEDETGLTSTSTITLHCNCPEPVIASDIDVEFNCPCNSSKYQIVDLLKYVTNPTNEGLKFTVSNSNATVDGSKLTISPSTELEIDESISFNYLVESDSGTSDTGVVNVTCKLNMHDRNFTIFCVPEYEIKLTSFIDCFEWTILDIEQPDFGSVTVLDDDRVKFTGTLSNQQSTKFNYHLTDGTSIVSASIILNAGQIDPICNQDFDNTTINRVYIGSGSWDDLPNSWAELADSWELIVPLIHDTRVNSTWSILPDSWSALPDSWDKLNIVASNNEYLTDLIDLNKSQFIVPAIDTLGDGEFDIQMQYGDLSNNLSTYVEVKSIKCRYVRFKAVKVSGRLDKLIVQLKTGNKQEVDIDLATYDKKISTGRFNIEYSGLLGVEILKASITPFSYEVYVKDGVAEVRIYDSLYQLVDCSITVLLHFGD
jgi:hypothetical protein